jgi:3-keto-disaccharide hydrolase/Short C-terminal domain
LNDHFQSIAINHENKKTLFQKIMKIPRVCHFAATLLLAFSMHAQDANTVIHLLNGQDFNNWHIFLETDGVNNDPQNVFSWRDGQLRISGGEKGYLLTTNEFSNYRLLVEYRWGNGTTNGDSGVFVNAGGPDAIWIKSHECDLEQGNGRHGSGDVILLGGAGLTVGDRHSNWFNPRAGSRNYENPNGDWNTMEIRCVNGHLTVRINGQIAVEGTDAAPSQGKIAIQSNHGEIFFRRCDLYPLPAESTDAESPVAPESAFTPIFNGTDLTGWTGDSQFWSVENGAIVGHLANVPTGEHYLVWDGGSLNDFELRFDYWLPGDWKHANGEAGVRFRALSETDGKYLGGYDADIAGPSRYHSTLLDFSAPGQRRDLAFAGQSTITREINGTNKMQVIGHVAVTPEQMQADYKDGDWNQVSILAQSNHIQIRINGHLLNDCTDGNEKNWRRSGLLALKLWMYQGPTLTARFKNLRLRRLSDGEVVPKPVFVSKMQSTSAPPAQNKSDAAERLKKLQSLYDQGLINKDDFEKKKKEILDSL